MLAFPIPGLEIDLRSLFNRCNHHYFQGFIHPSEGFALKFYRGEKLFGYFSYCRETHQDRSITVSRRLRHHPRALRNTLVHEMIHMLAHQRYRTTGDAYFLDLSPAVGHSFVDRGHGAFFLATMSELNRRHPELGLAVVSYFGDEFYEQDKIDPVRLMIVHIDRDNDKGMVYRLHPQAALNWSRLRDVAVEIHASSDIELLQVAGANAEGFPTLRRDNGSRINMKARSLRNFGTTVRGLKCAGGTIHLGEFALSVEQKADAPILRQAS